MLSTILAHTPVASVDEAVSLMTAIDGALPDADGLKWFNRLYLRVTVAVRAALVGTSFHDPGFMVQLDIAFANLYFEALVTAQMSVDAAPAAWRPLLRERHTPRIARLQFALAGMNAHINRDLPDGIVRTFRQMGGVPATAVERRQDFEAVNGILVRVEEDVKTEFSTGLVGEVDTLAGAIDDIAAMWSVRAARAAAWTNAEVLWALQVLPSLRSAFFDRLDSLTGLAARGLLRPIVLPSPHG